MYVRVFLLTLVLMLFVSCTSTRVHLFTDGMSDDELLRIESVLAGGGFEVVRNSLPIPEGIRSPTIVYSPDHRQLRKVEDLRELLASHDLFLNLEPISRSNHFYTAENVGLYPNAYVEGAARSLPLVGIEMFGECPDVDAFLLLRGDLTFLVEFVSWDETTNSETTRHLQGVWRRDQQTIVLSANGSDFSFEVTRFTENSDYAKIDGIKLSGFEGYRDFEDCDFAYREMDPW
jgi:hypothetical protein